MLPVTLSPESAKTFRSQLFSFAMKGQLRGQLLRRISSSKEWDERTNFHRTPELPCRVKNTYFNDIDGYLNLEPFLFTDADVRVTLLSEQEFELESDTSKYRFVFSYPAISTEGTASILPEGTVDDRTKSNE